MTLDFIQEPQLEFLREGKYISNNQTPQQRFQEVVDKVREYEHLYSEGLADRVAYMLDKNILSLSTPALSNFGRLKEKDSKTTPLPASCNIITVGNSIADIYSSIGQAAMLSKLGAGVGSDFQLVEQKGTELSEGFFSNSKLDWIEDIVSTGQKVSQGSNRRGYVTPFLSIEDNDFDGLMDRIDKSNPDKNDRLVNNTVGIILPRGFRDKLTTDKEAQRRYLKVLKQKQKTGRVYLLDTDNCMKNNSPVYAKLGYDAWTTNICCVTGETLILTDKGQTPIVDLVGKPTNVWNGEEFSEVIPFLVAEKTPVYRVNLDDGKHIDVTDNHNFYVQKGKSIEKIPTSKLKEGMKLISYKLPSTAYSLRVDSFEAESEHKPFLKDLQLQLQEQGIDTVIKSGLVDNTPIFILKQRKPNTLSKIHSIVSLPQEVPVYCFTEPKRGMGMFNGVLTGQSEFIQPLFPDMTSVCVISALNLVHWGEIQENPQMIKDAFMFLDILNEEYVKLTEGVPFMEKARKAALEKRDIGLGTLGFAELLQMKGYAYGDLGSRRLNKEIFSTIRKYGEEYTYEIGLKLGSPKICQQAGMIRRNASLMMVAPNKSTSFISGATSGGIEPRMSNIFVKSLAKIQYVFKNKQLEKLLETKGKNTFEVWDSISDNNGSVQHLDFLTPQEKDIFRTFEEVSPKDIIDLAADRQEYIDMGQSLNLIFRKNYDLKDIYDIHKYGWDKGIKTFYYGYSSAHAALEKEGARWDDCVSCAD